MRRFTPRCQSHFYPRSPCGERPLPSRASTAFRRISIHALLAESDPRFDTFWSAYPKFLSTLSLRRATALMTQKTLTVIFLSTLSLRRATLLRSSLSIGSCISIHALLAESDPIISKDTVQIQRFLSTLSLRRATLMAFTLTVKRIFLSTLSLRRATIANGILDEPTPISIHALLAESDK